MATRSTSQLKAWFRRGKYPTEEQFADWIDSYVHKNESKIPIAQVENLSEQLNGKYAADSGNELERNHNKLKSDFDTHKEYAERFLGEITDDIDVLEAENERQQGEINTANANQEHLRKRVHPTASFTSLESTFATLGANYSTLWALANTLKTFLEANDTSDATINRWKELEAFLQGITDTETLSGLLEQLQKDIIAAVKIDSIVDLGVVSNQAAAENAAAERSVTENSDVRIIMWRTGDNGRGDGGQIIQSRWGNYYVIQVMMFVGQEHSCRYRLITTGGNYSVGEWNDLIIPSNVFYSPGTHRVMYNGFLPGADNEKTLFEIPVADDEELGIVRIGGPFYMGENDELNIRTGKGITFDGFGNIQAKVNTAHGLDFYKDNSLAIKAGKGIGFEEDSGGITVLYDKGLAFDEDGKLRVNTGEGITFDYNGGIALNIGTDTDKYKGLIFNEGSRTIGVNAGKGLTFNNYELVLNLAEEGGLVLDGGKLKIKEGWRPVPQGKRSATPADNCFVYATDDPESKSSVLNAPDTLLKQKDGHLMFQKGMWNPNGEAIFYTRNQVPVATESCDGVMSSGDKRNLNNLLNPKNASGLKKLGDGIYISTGAGIRINGDNELTLNLADGGGLVFDDYSKLTIDVPKLKELLGLS